MAKKESAADKRFREGAERQRKAKKQRKTGKNERPADTRFRKTAAKQARTKRSLAAIDDIMREEKIPAGGVRFENAKGKRVSKADLIDNQGRLKTGRIVTRGGATGDEAGAVGFSGGAFH